MFSLMRRGLNSAVFVCVRAGLTGSAPQDMNRGGRRSAGVRRSYRLSALENNSDERKSAAEEGRGEQGVTMFRQNGPEI